MEIHNHGIRLYSTAYIQCTSKIFTYPHLYSTDSWNYLKATNMELLQQILLKKEHTHKTCNTYKELHVKENCMVIGTGKKIFLEGISD